MTRRLDLGVEKRVLGNGARLLAARTPGRRRAMLSVDYRTGSRFEEPGENGISHFLEHMLFRGTPEHPSSHLLATAFEDLGGTLEASTAADRGDLAICLPVVNLPRAIELVAEVFTRPLLRDVEVERSIIREEIQEDFDDVGQLVDGASALRKLAFGDRGLGQLITGPAENLDSFHSEQLRRHHQKTHAANHLVATVAGDVDPDALLEMLERAFGGVAPGEELPLVSPEPQDTPRFSYVDHAGSSQTAVHLGFRGPGQLGRLEPALEMLLRVIDDGMSTRLYQRLVDQSGLCYDAGASIEVYTDISLVEFEATTSHASCSRVVEEFFRLSAELRQGPLPSAEVERARRRVLWEYEALTDSVVDVAEVLAHSEFTATPSPEARLEQLLAVTAEDMREAAEVFLGGSGRSLVAIGQLSPGQSRKLAQLASEAE